MARAVVRLAIRASSIGDGFEFNVTDTQKDGGLVIHKGHLLKGVMREGAKVKAVVDAERRAGIRRAHYLATHILHYALHKNLGSQRAAARLESGRGLAAIRLYEPEPCDG